jgi:hypothetical protein
MSVRALRAFFIRKILDTRFGLDVLQRRIAQDPEGWNSSGNECGRARYEEAMRERQRLEVATESELAAMVFGDDGGVTPPARAAGSTPS